MEAVGEIISGSFDNVLGTNCLVWVLETHLKIQLAPFNQNSGISEDGERDG